MKAAIIILLFISVFLFFYLRLAFKKIYNLQEKIENLENLSQSIKKVLLEKTPQIPNDIKIYKELKGFEEQYIKTKQKQEKEGKKLFGEILEKAQHYYYDKRLNDIVLELWILNKTKEIDHLRFYALYQKHQYSREKFAKALERFFNNEIKNFSDDSYDENKKKFIEQAKILFKDEKDQRLILALNSLDKSSGKPIPEAQNC